MIVVGGGHNGLVCAAYLARAGKRVVLVEARPSVGGCASTVDALGARVNICNCDHFAVRSLPIVEELGLARHGLRYLDLDLTMAALSWSGDQPFLQFHDLDRTLASLHRTLPAQVEGYRRFVADALPALRLVLRLAEAPPGPGAGLAALAARHGQGLGTLIRWSRRSAAQVLRRYFDSETILGAAVAGGPAVWGVSPHTPGTGLGALRLAMPHALRPGRPVGGSGALTDALRASFEAAGGQVRTGVQVRSVLVEPGGVLGVRVLTGPPGGAERSETSVWTAQQVVVACDPRATAVEWTAATPAAAAVEGVVHRWQGAGSPAGYESKLDALVGELPSYRCLDERLRGDLGVSALDVLSATAFITPSLESIAAAHSALTRNEVVAEPILLANLPSVADPTMLGPHHPTSGPTHVFSLEVLFTPYGLAGGWPASPEPARWLAAYARHTEGDFLAGVQQWRAMTPDRYEAEFFMPKGYAQSFAGGPLASLLGRDRELSRYQTPVAGLFLTGAATFPGAGIWGASGRNAARVVLGA